MPSEMEVHSTPRMHVYGTGWDGIYLRPLLHLEHLALLRNRLLQPTQMEGRSQKKVLDLSAFSLPSTDFQVAKFLSPADGEDLLLCLIGNLAFEKNLLHFTRDSAQTLLEKRKIGLQ